MSKIEWTEQTWNPIIGCSKTSEGCANCYAEKTAARLARIETTAYYGEVVEDGQWNGKTAFIDSQMRKPLDRKKPTLYFVGSMTDLFHSKTAIQHVNRVFWTMGFCSQHRFIVLTKRPEMMQMYMGFQKDFCERYNFTYPLPNVILGVTAENQEQADKRIPILLDTPAAARFVSIEPMLGPVDLTAIMGNRFGEIWNTLDTEWDENACKNGPALDWVICGGESGPGARPIHPDWARSLRDQCKEAGVPFFFKQWGEWSPDGWVHAGTRFDDRHVTFNNRYEICHSRKDFTHNCNFTMKKVGKKSAGNVLGGQLHEEYPEILREVQDA